MPVTVTHNSLPTVRRALKRFFKEEAPKIAAEVINQRIQARTDKGVDSSGRTFRKYSPLYAKYGRKKLGYQVSPVNLSRTGNMRASLQYYNRTTVGDGTGHALAVSIKENPKAQGNQTTREWVGLNPTDKQPIERALIDALSKKQF
jgi:NADH/NAD ratio-sensing transcriptional regulator Rex